MKKLFIIMLLCLGTIAAYSQGQSGNSNPPDHNNQPCPKGQTKVYMNGHWKCDSMVVLPVTVISFSATRSSSIVRLEWKVTDIVHHDYYVIDHSTDGKNWKSIIRTTNKQAIHRPQTKDNYYRLCSVDLDGTLNYYKIIYVRAQTRKYIVYSFYGDYLGEFYWEEIPKNVPLIINGIMTVIRSY